MRTHEPSHSINDAQSNGIHNAEAQNSGLPDQSWGTAPLVHYTLGWLHEKLGDARRAAEEFRQAAKQSPDYCFPARLEEIAVLESAIRANLRDARAPYYLGNLLYDRRRHAEAIKLLETQREAGSEFFHGLAQSRHRIFQHLEATRKGARGL